MTWLKSLPTERVLLLLVILASAVLYLPSFGVYFYADDLDRVGGLAYARESDALLRYLTTPHNDHFEPFVKLILFLSIQVFGTAAHLPLHGLLLLSLAACTFVLYRVAAELFENRQSALLGAALFGLSTVYSDAGFFLSGSNLYVLLFSLVTLYSMLRYAREEKPIYAWTAFVAAFLATLTMASSYLLGLWIILFFWLCVPRRKRGILIPPLAGWALGLGLIASLHGMAILKAPHYQIWREGSALEIFSLWQGIWLSLQAFLWLLKKYSWSLPVVLIVFLPAASAALHVRCVRWRAVLFFVLFVFGNYFIVYAFRHPWGPDVIKWPRNHLPGAWGFAMIFAGLTAPLIRRLFDQRREFFAPVLICFAALHGSYNALLLPRLLPDTSDTQKIVRESEAFARYFEVHPGERRLAVKDVEISLTSYGRKPLSHLLMWMVPREVRQRIQWSDRTAPSFVRFLEKNQEKYLTLYHMMMYTIHHETDTTLP